MPGLRINFILPELSATGGMNSNALIGEALARRGHDVTLYYTDPPPPPPTVRSVVRRARRRLRGVRTTPPPRSERLSFVGVPRAEVRSDDVRDADLTIATWWETREWLEGFADSKGQKGYFIRHLEMFAGHHERVEATYRMPGHRFVIARWLQDEMTRRGLHSDYVPNGVDRSLFFPPEAAADRGPVVGVAYSRVGWKGTPVALRAMTEAKRAVPELECVAFGAHPLKLGQARPAGFAYARYPSRAGVADHYRRARVWLLASETEGFGMPGLEALACGCPVVATRCGGPEDYVEPGRNGTLVDVGDASAMAAAIVEHVRMPGPAWRERSVHGRAVADRYDWDASAGRLLDALDAGVPA